MKCIYLIIPLAVIATAMFGVSGHITTDTTWNTNQIVTGVLYVDEGITLTIMPGVQVTFPKIDQNADGIGDVYIEVSGRLQVQGTVASKVMFTSNQTNPAPSDWLGIKYITPQSGMLSTISNAEILYAYEPLFINGRNMTLNNVRIAYSGDYGMRINNTFLNTNITNCTIEENASYGLLIEAGPVTITGLVLFHNGSYGIKILEPAAVTASEVVASTNGDTGIWIIDDNDASFSNSRSISNGYIGVWLDGSTVTLNNCDISNNLYGFYMDGMDLQPAINHCRIDYNTLAGLHINSSDPILTQSEILNNGLGVYILESTPTVNYCHIYGNHGQTSNIVYRTNSEIGWVSNSNHPQNNFIPGWFESIEIHNYSSFDVGGSFTCRGEIYPFSVFSRCTVTVPIGNVALANSDIYYSVNFWAPNEVVILGYNYRPYTFLDVSTQALVGNSANVIANLNFNWWGQVNGVDSLIVQQNAGTASYETYLTNPIPDIGCNLPNLSPSLSLTAPSSMMLNPASVDITWTDRDLDDNAQISLYYTEDPAQVGTMIAENIYEDSNTNSYIWDCSSVPYGTYYIKAIISDGVNPPVTSTSSGRVMVGALQVKMPTNATGVAGTQVLIPVQTVNTIDYFNIISFQFTLTYSNNIIQGVGVDTENTLTSETWLVYANTSIPGQISVNGFSTEPLNASGNLVNIIFNVQPGAVNYATSPLNFADLVLNNGTPEPTLVNGLFRVVNQYSISGNVHYYMGSHDPIANVMMTLSGDETYQVFSQANGDFIVPPVPAGNYVLTPSCETAIPSLIVTPYDASLTAQFALDLYPFTNEQQKAADVNGDNQATVFDAALIAQYSVGLIDAFTPGIWGFSPPHQNYDLVNNFINVQFLGYAVGDPSGNWSTRGSENSRGFSIPVFAGKGSSISIPISWDQEFLSGYVQLRFDPQQLRYLGTEHSTATTSLQHLQNVSEGVLRIASYGVQPVISSEPVYNFRFEVLDGVNDAIVYLDAVEFDETPADLGNTGIVDGDVQPVILNLEQNYPNPFNPVTNIKYSNPVQSRVRLSVFNLKGQLVKELVNDVQCPGNYTISLDASGLGSGIYFYRLDTETGSITRKMVLSK